MSSIPTSKSTDDSGATASYCLPATPISIVKLNTIARENMPSVRSANIHFCKLQKKGAGKENLKTGIHYQSRILRWATDSVCMVTCDAKIRPIFEFLYIQSLSIPYLKWVLGEILTFCNLGEV